MVSDTKLKDFFAIGFSQIFINICGFLLLPVITKNLSPFEYGIWIQLTVTVSLLVPFVVLGNNASIIRLLSHEKNCDTIREDFYSVVFFVAATSLIVSILIFLVSDQIAPIIFNNGSYSQFLKAGSFLIFLTALDQITLTYFRIFDFVQRYALFQIFNSISRLILIIILLHLGFGLIGVILASLLVQGIILIITLFYIVDHLGFRFPSFIHLREYLQYGVPLAPNGLIKWITDSSDRYLIGYILGMQAVGIYSASYVLGNLLFTLVVPIQMILFPELSRLYEEKKIYKVTQYLRYSIKYFLMIAIPGLVGLSVLSIPLIRIFSSDEYVSGSAVIPLIALSALFAGVFQISINVTHLVKRTRFNFIIHTFAALTNICLNIILIPLLGMIGATCATAIAYGVMMVICLFISFKYIKFEIDLLFIGKSLIASCIMGLCMLIIHPVSAPEVVLVIGGSGVIYFTVMILENSFDPVDSALLKMILSPIFGKKNR